MDREEPQALRADAGAPPAAPAAAAEPAALDAIAVPADALILITTRNLVLFPGIVLPMTLGPQRPVAAAQTPIRTHRPARPLPQRGAPADDTPTGRRTL